MAEICESRIPVDHLIAVEICDACHTSFINRTGAITVAGGQASLVPTVRYRICLHPRGFGLGKHLYSMTLVPGEELELEVFRSAKVTEELSKELSVEETYAQEFSSTVQNEWSARETSNFKIGGGVSASLDLGIFSIGGSVEPEYSTQEETFQKSFKEFSTKAQAKTDRKFDVSMDVKTETVSSTRSTRKVRNFNQCQPVTYNYFQLMRRMRLEVIIDGLFFDVTQRPHPVLTNRLGAVLHVARFVPPRSQEILSAIPAPVPGPDAHPGAVAPQAPPISVVAQATVQHPVIADDFNQPVRQLTLEQLARLNLAPDLLKEVLAVAQRLTERFPEGKVVFTSDFCVNTTGVTVEAFTGRCLACDTHTALVEQADREKLRVDLLKAKLSGVASAAAYGFVRSAEGAAAGAGMRLKKGATVLGETVTDADGLYILSAKGLADPGDTLTVEVAALPPGATSVSPLSASFKHASAPVQVDFVAG